VGGSIDPSQHKANTPRNATSSQLDFIPTLNMHCSPSELDERLHQAKNDAECAMTQHHVAVVNSIKAVIDTPSSSATSREAVEARRTGVVAKVAADAAVNAAMATHADAKRAAASVAATQHSLASQMALHKPVHEAVHAVEKKGLAAHQGALAAHNRAVVGLRSGTGGTKVHEVAVAQHQVEVHATKLALDTASQQRKGVEDHTRQLQKAKVEVDMLAIHHAAQVQQKASDVAVARSKAKSAGDALHSMYGQATTVHGGTHHLSTPGTKNVGEWHDKSHGVGSSDDSMDVAIDHMAATAASLRISFDSSWHTFHDDKARTCSYHKDDTMVVCPMNSNNTCPTESSAKCTVLKPLKVNVGSSTHSVWA
jgi:hypothetical protein